MRSLGSGSVAAMLGLVGLLLGCSPKTETVEGGTPDLSMLARDMGVCAIDPANLIQNPGFETPSKDLDGNGKANNTGTPGSSIPNWDGCCSQATGGTSWTIATSMPHCDLRSLTVVSTTANANVLNQALPVSGKIGKSLSASAYVFVPSLQPGGKLAIDIWDDTAKKVIATSAMVTTTTPDWLRLQLSVPIPSPGNLQYRINTSGTLTALVDDPVVLVP